MKRGRPALTVPPATWKVNIPSTLAAEIELLLFNPVKEEVTYGARSQLIESLLRGWVEEKRQRQC